MATKRAEKMMEQRVDVERPVDVASVAPAFSATSLEEVLHSVCLTTLLPTPAAHCSRVLMFT